MNSQALADVEAPPIAMSPPPAPANTPHTRAGVFYGIAAYALWGLFPLYFKAIATVPPLEIVCHRIVWSVCLLLLLTAVRRNWVAVRAAFVRRRTLLTLTATTLLIAGNWLMYVWAVANNRVLESSLGYYINPLLNVLLGFIFLRERLRPWQKCAVGVAALGVAYLTFSLGHLPLIALFLAGTFGAYGLLRKTAHVDALVGLTVETLLLAPAAVLYIAYQMHNGRAAFASGSARLDLLLLSAGVITAVPLIWFAAAARRLRLATMGFIQYLAPTGHFLLAVLAFGEPLTAAHIVTFGCIWTALAVYSIDAVRHARPSAPAPDAAPAVE